MSKCRAEDVVIATWDTHMSTKNLIRHNVYDRYYYLDTIVHPVAAESALIKELYSK